MINRNSNIDTQSLAIRLAKFASITKTSGELSYPDFLISVLLEIPFFSKRPNLVQEFEVSEDELKRRIVIAFAPGEGQACITLTGHYDVVDTSNYGALEPLAFDPDTLLKKMLQILSAKESLSPSEISLKKDLESGFFIPGRGILDMKSGLAVAITVISRFLGDPGRIGNIIFLAVPDEEGSSVGMKAAKKILSDFISSHQLQMKGIINLDAAVDQGDGGEGKAVFLGSVSKVLPFALFVGKPAHAGAPFDGFNPVLAASLFMREIECNSDCFGTRTSFPGEEPPPPTILYSRDMRTHYDVTMPFDIFCAVNILTFEKKPEKIFENFKLLVQETLNNAISLFYERKSVFSRKKNEHIAMQKFSSRVIDFSELVNKAEYVAPGILDRLRKAAEKNNPEDPVLQTAKIVHELLSFAQIEGPCAIVGFAPPFYAKAELGLKRDQDFLILLKDEIAQFNREYQESIKLRPFFPGISDMSILAPSIESHSIEYIKKQSAVIQKDLDKYLDNFIKAPVINIGPWGREYHQWGERVNRYYAFNVLPDLVFRICQRILIQLK